MPYSVVVRILVYSGTNRRTSIFEPKELIVNSKVFFAKYLYLLLFVIAGGKMPDRGAGRGYDLINRFILAPNDRMTDFSFPIRRFRGYHFVIVSSNPFAV